MEWRNDAAHAFLQGIADWLNGRNNEQINWQILADALLAARGERYRSGLAFRCIAVPESGRW